MFTVFLICDLLLCLIVLVGRGFLVLCFMVLEFGVILFLIYE